MADLPDFEAWAIFAQVAELRSVSRAAAVLGVSKATVSKALTRLEHRLGMPLLHRSSRKLSLTEAGRSSREAACQMLADGAALEEALSDEAAEPVGLVRMTAPLSFGIQSLGPLLPEFLARYPKITLDLRLSDRTDLVVEAVDVALRIGLLPDSALRARWLFDIRRPLVASPAYVGRLGRPLHPRELEQHQAVLFTQLPTPMIWPFSHPIEGDWSVRMTGHLHLDNDKIAVPALVGGIGVGILPEFLVWEDLRAGRLVELLPDWVAPPTALHVMTPPGKVRPARVTLLIAFLANQFREAPWAHGGTDGVG